MTTTRIANIARLLDVTDYLGDFAGDFDVPAIAAGIAAALDDAAGDGVFVCGNGDVLADLDAADRARDIDWLQLLGGQDVDGIVQLHEMPGPIQCTAAAMAEATNTTLDEWGLPTDAKVSIHRDGTASANLGAEGTVYDLAAGNDNLRGRLAAMHAHELTCHAAGDFSRSAPYGNVW